MSGRGPRSFRYGPRLTITAPLAAVFIAVAAEMVMLALAAGSYWRIAFVVIAALAILLALSMVREAAVRLRGTRRIVVATRELIVPGTDRRSPAVTLAYRDIRKLELSADPGFKRVLTIGHVCGRAPDRGRHARLGRRARRDSRPAQGGAQDAVAATTGEPREERQSPSPTREEPAVRSSDHGHGMVVGQAPFRSRGYVCWHAGTFVNVLPVAKSGLMSARNPRSIP